MSYDDSSNYGNFICENFDENNNFMNPESDMGWFFYNLIGKSFDYLSDEINKLALNISPVRCEKSYLDLLAIEFNIKRNSEWSDNEYRAVIMLNSYNVMTIRGLEYFLNQLVLTQTNDADGYITIGYIGNGFHFSNESNINELVSSSTIENDLLTEHSSVVARINVPDGVDTSLIEFIIDYLPSEVILND